MPLNHVYLQDDHLEWWSAHAPATPQVQARGQSRYRAFLREFYSNVAWVCGDATDLIDLIDPLVFVDSEGVEVGGAPAKFESFPMRRTNWRNAPNGFQPAPELRVRAASTDGSPPILADVALQRDGLPQRRVIRSADRTSIWIDFVHPQRAVGLQCGFLGAANRGIDQGHFKLEAWRVDGSLVGVSSGSDLRGAVDWRALGIELIAIRDEHAGIRTVRFYCDDPGFELNESLFLYRVWYETLPIAFVRQGTIANMPLSTFRGHQHVGHVDLPPAPGNAAADALQHPSDPPVFTAARPDMASGTIGVGSITLRLPMDCDRAEVFVRGFKVIPGVGGTYRREPYIQKFSQLGFALKTTNRPDTRNRSITFELDGQYHWGDEGEERVDALLAVYWSVLAWRSDRADLFAASTLNVSPDHPRKSKALIEFRHGRPLIDAPTLAAAGPEAVYGPLFGGVTQYRLSLPRPVEPQTYMWYLGTMGDDFPEDEFFDDESRTLWEYILSGFATTGSVGVLGGIAITKWIVSSIGDNTRMTPIVALPAPLRYSANGERIEWSWVGSLEETLDTDERATTLFGGTVLSGASLVPGIVANGGDSAVTRTFQPAAGSRESNDAPFNTYSLEFAFAAEQALVVLQGFTFIPEDEVRELDVEVRAARFDGQRLNVAAGGGVEITEQPRGLIDEPSLSVGASGGFTTLERFVIGFPNVVGIRRVERAIRMVLTTRAAEFDWVDGTRDDHPKVVGYLRNDGNVPVGVRALRIDGQRSPAFDLRFTYQGSTRWLNAFKGVLPLTLMPGERIEVLGSFAPAGVPARPPVAVGAAASVRAVFSLTSGQSDISVEVRAERKPLRPSGFFFPPSRAFGQVRVTGLQVMGGGSNTLGSATIGGAELVPVATVRRAFALMNYGQDALVVRSLAFDPLVPGLSFRVVKYPLNLGQLRPAGNTRYVLEPGTSLDCEMSWGPLRVGPMRTRIVADTNQGQLVMEVAGEGIPA